jgi:hypothetical protein
VATTGALVNDGYVYLYGGSCLTTAGTLANSSLLSLGNNALSASDTVTAASLDNTGYINLTGVGTNLATLNVSGATTNNGSISITTDTEELAGAVGGTGSLNLSSANLLFDSTVSAGQTIKETGVDGLTLKQAQKFHATISGFGAGDTIDAANFLLSGTTFNFAGGTLTLHDQTDNLTGNIHFTGQYTNANFKLVADSGTGTLVKFV